VKIWSNTNTLEFYLKTEFTKNCDEAEILLVGSKPFSLEKFPNVRGIFRAGVGLDNIPHGEVKEKNIQVRLPSEKTQDYIYEETANFACFLIMKMLYRDVGDVKNWEKKSRPFEKHVVVLGLGKIGKKVFDKMEKICNLSWYDPYVVDFRPNKHSTLTSALTKADVVSLHMGLSPNTKGLLGAAELRKLKNGAAIVNTARGAIVDELSLYNELWRIAAAFDVFWEEPYRGILVNNPNFYMTPHVASTNSSFLKSAAEDFLAFVKELECVAE
jgi:phosphoglycerate dehydrogenase-like enzyme